MSLPTLRQLQYLKLLAEQIDKLKQANPEAAKALTEKLATTFDTANEDLIKQVRGEAIANS